MKMKNNSLKKFTAPIQLYSKKLVTFLDKNSPAILTTIGAAGSVVGAYLTGKAAVKAHYILKDKHEEEAANDIHMKKHEHLFSDVSAVAKTFAPAVIVEAAAVGCIVGSYKINTKRLAAATALLAANRNEFKEYKDKVKELIGTEEEQKVQEAIIKDHVDKGDYEYTETDDLLRLMETSDVQRFCDPKSGRIFVSTKGKIREAVSDFNERFDQGEMWQSLNDFYGYLGLDYTDLGDKYQFTGDRRLEVRFGDAEKDRDDRSYVPLIYDVYGMDDRSW